ncbi:MULTISPECIES: hypothetical protein [Pseudomonas]|uniref:hypothetical protein n=1 Tax=Pseudomonas TaxID=286 RepID=UPI00128EF4D5|nr:hypothetical protein [Pseudomonas fuscovaginae]
MKEQRRSFDPAELSRRIRLQVPYFAFQALWQEGESLIGTFTCEQPLVHEVGPITAGELGRHMAILGGCAAVALHNGADGYYLATRAHFIRKSTEQAMAQEGFHASAQVVNLDKRSLEVSARAWGREPIAELICEYAILSPALFQRNFRSYANDSRCVTSRSPYQWPVPIYSLMYQHEQLEALAGPLSAQQCAGHFPGFPCWPVAIISQTAFQVTGELLRKKYGMGTRFCVRDTQLSAEKLMGADSVLKFSVEITPDPANSCWVRSRVSVYHGDERVVYLLSQLELVLAT